MATNPVACPCPTGPKLVDYRKGVYEVIEEHGSLVRVRPQGEHDDWHAFWIQRATVTLHVVKPLYKLYRGLDLPDYVVSWCMQHVVTITASMPEKDEARFAYNLKEANGQEYTRLLEGVQLAGMTAGIAMLCTFDEVVPDAFDDDIYNAQLRWGCRKNTPRVTEHPNTVFCNALAWELLRNGKQLG